MAEIIKKRSEVPVEQTWDLSLIYKTPEEMESELARMQTLCAQIVEKYQGKLATAQAVNACLELYREEQEITGLCANYVSLALSVDYGNAVMQQQNDRVMNVITRCESDLCFLETEIAALDETVLHEAVAQAKSAKGYLQRVLRKKPHQLHPETERVLTALLHTTNLPYEIYNVAKLADMRFDEFTADGKTYPLSYTLFENAYQYEPDTAVRRAAFAAFSEKLRQYENVTAAAYNGQVQFEKSMARLRGFDSVIDNLLFEQKVDRALYDRQIDVIMEKLAPHMRRYARLIQQTYGLEEMTFADLKLPLDADYCPAVTIEEAKQYAKEGLVVMGEDYLQMVERAFEERWFDFAQNEGKTTGGFCSSPYGRNSYILLSWNGKMSDVFTIVHELGHAGHFALCNEAQSIFDTMVSAYVVEAPSTMNELLLSHDLIRKNPDKRFRRWVLANMVSNTYYHNFVTHLLEAAYQREVYRIVDAGGSVQAETLNSIMRDVLTRFWGEDVKISEGAKLTWMRQPHYYMGLYSYTYSAGLTIATQVCRRIETEGEAAIAGWKAAMRAGATVDPVQFAAMAGVDITTDAALLDTIGTIGGYIDEIIKLTEELKHE